MTLVIQYLEVNPSPIILANGIGGSGHSQYSVYDDGNPMKPVTIKKQAASKKPPYRVPTMAEIAAIPWNGLTVASTFSGAGGSCTGYRMAGYRVVWANEFVPMAQESYRANASEHCFLDCRDIKQVQPEDILTVTGLKVGELDIFDGSPPCQAFSTAGKREKGWGQGKQYEHGAVQCNETLFDQYTRLLRGLQPKVFIAENVSGLIKGTAKGYFLEILKALKDCGYRVTCRVLDAQWLGVPQQRQRTIFVGVRNDLNMDPVHPKPLPYRYSVRDALPNIGRAIHDTSGIMSRGDVTDRPSPTVMAGRAGTHFAEQVQVFHENGGFSRTECTDKPSPTITATQCRMTVEPVSGDEVLCQPLPAAERSGTEVTEIQGKIYDQLKPGQSFDKVGKEFGYKGGFGKIRTDADGSSPTVLTSPDLFHPVEKRKFTIDEVKRICSFPDDFILKGSYAQQWERLGNSVPPVMMKHIAEEIRDKILLVPE